MPSLSKGEFIDFASAAARSAAIAPAATTLAVPVSVRVLADQLTPVLAYRRLVDRDERTAPSFLLESVASGSKGAGSQGRYSLLGARPLIEVAATGLRTAVLDRREHTEPTETTEPDPVSVLRRLTSDIRLAVPPGQQGATRTGGLLPDCVLGGWFGYAGYDTVRYTEPDKLDPARAAEDDRNLPDLQFGFYDGIVAFDHVERVVHVVRLVLVPAEHAERDAAAAYDATIAAIDDIIEALVNTDKHLAAGRIERDSPRGELHSNMPRERFLGMVERAKEYILDGDIFQVVLGQRFERRSPADPFDVYRALRAINPSPYMVYLQARGTILVASSPEILCRVRAEHTGGAPRLRVVNRPLAGTRPRGDTPERDHALEAELLADAKERAEHVMLVDLGRNDVGRVARPGTVKLPTLMAIERYSHVMHISSTVTGELRDGLDCWDALRAALPVGTISGAPKVRAMQIIDELEPHRRGPYGGGMGWIGLDGQMDIALALRTIVTPTQQQDPRTGNWVYHLQAAAGIVADSKPEAEYDETVAKAAALARAIDLAEHTLTEPKGPTPGPI